MQRALRSLPLVEMTPVIYPFYLRYLRKVNTLLMSAKSRFFLYN